MDGWLDGVDGREYLGMLDNYHIISYQYSEYRYPVHSIHISIVVVVVVIIIIVKLYIHTYIYMHTHTHILPSIYLSRTSHPSTHKTKQN